MIEQKNSAKYSTYPMFDHRTRWLYILLAASVVAELLLLFALGLRLDSGPIIAAQTWPVLVIGAWASRRIGFDRLATGLEAIALLYGQSLALCFSTAVLATISGPLVDKELSAADHFLGFDWLFYYHLTQPYLTELRMAYLSFLWLPAVVIIGLTIERQFDRVWQFVTAAMVALIVTIVIFPFAPAASPVVLHHLPDPELEGVARFWPILVQLRSGAVDTIGLQHVVGMVSFPSYHTVAAILIAWAAWGSRWLRWPIVAMCGLMLLAIPISGDHYFVDMIVGAALAVAVIPLGRALMAKSFNGASSAGNG